MKREHAHILVVGISLAFINLSIAGQGVAAADYYVDPSGNATASGTQDDPFATVQQAQQAIRRLNRQGVLTRPVNVIFRKGLHFLVEPLVLTSPDSGSKAASVIYRAAQGGGVTLSGGRRITSWQKKDGRIYQVQLPEVAAGQWYFRHLYIGGKRGIRARSPNYGPAPNCYRRLVGVKRTPRSKPLTDPKQIETHKSMNTNFTKKGPLGAFDTYTLQVHPEDIDLTDWDNLRDCEIVALKKWATLRKKIESINIATGEITLQQPHALYFAHNSPKKGYSYFVENALELLDAENEWYLNRKTGVLYYIPEAGVDMATVEVIAPALTELLIIHGTSEEPVSNIHFRDLTFAHAERFLPSSGHHGRQACFDYRGNDEEGYMESAITWWHARNCSITGCDIKQLGGGGVALMDGCADIVIEGNHIHDISGNGISAGRELKGPNVPQRVRIANNHIHHCGQVYFGACGIFAATTRYTVIANNLIHDLPYTGISSGWWAPGQHYTKWPDNNEETHHMVIERNHVYDVMQQVTDGGCIYTMRPQPDSYIRFNHLHGVRANTVDSSSIESQGIFFDSFTAGFTVEGNLIYDCVGGPIRRNKPSRDEDYVWRGNSFDMANHYPQCPHQDNLEPNEFTLVAEFSLNEKIPNKKPQWIVGKNKHEDIAGHYGLIIRGDRPGVVLNYGGKGRSVFLFSDRPASCRTVTRLAATFDGKTLALYLGRQSVGNVEVPNPRPKGKGKFTIGRRPDGFAPFKNGRINYIGLWDKVVNTNEIANLPQNSDNQSGPIFQWHRTQKAKDIAVDFDDVRRRAGLESIWKRKVGTEKQ